MWTTIQRLLDTPQNPRLCQAPGAVRCQAVLWLVHCPLTVNQQVRDSQPIKESAIRAYARSAGP